MNWNWKPLIWSWIVDTKRLKLDLHGDTELRYKKVCGKFKCFPLLDSKSSSCSISKSNKSIRKLSGFKINICSNGWPFHMYIYLLCPLRFVPFFPSNKDKRMPHVVQIIFSGQSFANFHRYVYLFSLDKIKYLHLLADVNPCFGDIFCDYKINYAHVFQEKNK